MQTFLLNFLRPPDCPSCYGSCTWKTQGQYLDYEFEHGCSLRVTVDAGRSCTTQCCYWRVIGAYLNDAQCVSIGLLC